MIYLMQDIEVMKKLKINATSESAGSASST